MALCSIWEYQQICLHWNVPRVLLFLKPLFHLQYPENTNFFFFFYYVFMSDSNSALGFILTTMVKNGFLVLSGIFFPQSFSFLLILSIVHFCQCISSFGFYVITIILDLFYSSMTHSPSVSRGKNSSSPRPLLISIECFPLVILNTFSDLRVRIFKFWLQGLYNLLEKIPEDED